MNIFYVDSDPAVAAQSLCDSHVVKMILESAQMLSTAHRILDDANYDWLYKSSHINHPCNKWIRLSGENYNWLYLHMIALGQEYTIRYKKKHKTIIDKDRGELLSNPPLNIGNELFSEPPRCMPDDCKTDSTVESYINYYNKYKKQMAKWNYTKKPVWFEEEI